MNCDPSGGFGMLLDRCWDFWLKKLKFVMTILKLIALFSVCPINNVINLPISTFIIWHAKIRISTLKIPFHSSTPIHCWLLPKVWVILGGTRQEQTRAPRILCLHSQDLPQGLHQRLIGRDGSQLHLQVGQIKRSWKIHLHLIPPHQWSLRKAWFFPQHRLLPRETRIQRLDLSRLRCLRSHQERSWWQQCALRWTSSDSHRQSLHPLGSPLPPLRQKKKQYPLHSRPPRHPLRKGFEWQNSLQNEWDRYD